ncbi:MgtC/SapB family protein [Viridibacillus sp. YIM B01967]|uniref:MgtC/SapB family protein n=1 Tax=Viridibacillus soli TaxID=2798301 RepID=A0ABS1H9V8_9BACL|nr:MgtC/SapB family protein [Viridibacillus soli]MBK3496208.1 MgtC/SapB family protein [Viridibacillus soli]
MDFLLNNSLTHEMLIKLIVAATLSLVIGIERELKRKPVGLKTSLVIATFSCLLTIISIESVYNAKPVPGINVTMDPLRLAAQIVSGIGFLGAGVILRKDNDSISGLTTAAMIWGAAGIGIAVGAGFYGQAIIAVIIVMIGIEILAPIFMRFGPKRLRMREVSLKILVKDVKYINDILVYLQKNDMDVDNMRIKDIRLANNELKHELDLRFSSLPKKDTISLYKGVRELHYIDEIEIEILS